MGFLRVALALLLSVVELLPIRLSVRPGMESLTRELLVLHDVWGVAGSGGECRVVIRVGRGQPGGVGKGVHH